MSSNDTRIDVQACHGANYSVGSMNLSLNDTNLSLSNDSLSLCDRHSQAIKNYPNSKALFSDVTPVITHFFIKQAVATDDNKRYYRVLSKLTSGQASRYLLAFFVPDICLASQAKHVSSTAPIHPLQGRTVYDGVTSQNKIAEGRICGAVASKTESGPRHPISPIMFNRSYSVASTQNLLGGYHA